MNQWPIFHTFCIRDAILLGHLLNSISRPRGDGAGVVRMNWRQGSLLLPPATLSTCPGHRDMSGVRFGHAKAPQLPTQRASNMSIDPGDDPIYLEVSLAASETIKLQVREIGD